MRRCALAALALLLLTVPAFAGPSIFNQGISRQQLGSDFVNNGLNDRFNRTSHPFNDIPTSAIWNISSATAFQSYSNEFFEWPGALTGVATCTGGWLITDTGTGVVNAVAGTTGYGGLFVGAGAVDNDCTTVILCGAPFKYVLGKRQWFAARVALSDADDQEAAFGFLPLDLVVANTDLHSEVIGLDDGLFFRKAETETAFTFSARKNDAEVTSVGSGTLADATFRIIAFRVESTGAITVWDGLTVDTLTQVGTIPAGGTTFPDDVALTLYFEAQSGDTSQSDSITVDWVFFAQER